MEHSDKLISEVKAILEKKHGREFSWKEAESANNLLLELCKIAFVHTDEEFKRQNLLAESPNGFVIIGKGNCQICGSSISNKDSWYDKFGIKCMICQNAINQKIIPNSVTNEKDSWYSMFDLLRYFNFNTKYVKNLVKESVLTCRTIKNDEGKVHLQLFLLKDNKGFFPPKKLLESRRVQVLRNNELYYTSEQWYDFLDEKLAKRLCKYSVIQYLIESLSKPIEGGQMLYKEINPLFL